MFSWFIYRVFDVVSVVEGNHQYNGKHIYGFIFAGVVRGIICLGDGQRPISYEPQGIDSLFSGGGRIDVPDLFFL